MKKILKYTGLTLLVLLVLGALAFTAFVYNVFEGSISDIRTGIPRTVDFYVGKRRLQGDFAGFPVPEFWPRFESGTSYAQVRRSGLYRWAEGEGGVTKALAEIERIQAQLATIPLVDVGILDDMIGEDLAVAGFLRAPGQTPSWAVYAQVSWKICAFYNLLGYAAMRDQLAAGGVQVEPKDGIFRLVPQGGQPVWMARVLDLVVVGNDEELVRESRGLASGEIEKDTLQVSPDYQDLVRGRLEDFGARRAIVPNAVEYKLDLTTIARDYPGFANFPGEGEELAQEAKLLRSFLQTKAMRALWGGLNFGDRTATALFSIDMNRNLLTESQSRFYAVEAVDLDNWVRPKLRCIPSTAAAFLLLRVPVQLFLEEFVASLEKDARDLIDEGLRRSGQRGGVRGLIDNFARGLEPYVLVIVRNNDYPKFAVEFEVKIPSPAPAVAWVVEVRRREKERVQQVLSLLRDHYRRFGFQNHYDLQAGPGGAVRIDEWPSTNIPATGQIAILDGGEQLQNMLMLSNSGKLLRECISAYFGQAGARPVSIDERLLETIQSYPESSPVSGLAWVQGERVREVAARYLDFALDAARSNEPDPNWMIVNRPAIERTIFEREFRGKAPSKFELRGRDREEFDKRVSDVMQLRWLQEGQGRGQAVVENFQDLNRYLQLLDAGYLVVRNDPRKIEGELRLYLKY